jgi:hypothetical protein
MAQHGRGGGGHHGGSSGFGGGGFSSHASRPSSGYSGVTGYRSTIPSANFSSGYSQANSNSYRYGAYSGLNRINRTIGRPVRYPYYGFAYYPLFGFNDGFYDPSNYYEPYSPYAPDVQYGLPPDPSVEMLGNPYPQAPYPEQYPGPSQYPGPYNAVPYSDPAPPAVPIIVVLKTGQKIEILNYGIMNNLLWDFSKPNSRRIPLSSIDVPASVKATEAAGGSFPEEFFEALPR